MSKAVLISIKPKWCEKIANGEKTIEVRKTKPNIEVPFKCYIYETTAKVVENVFYLRCTRYGKGLVIGEFICDEIDTYVLNKPFYSDCYYSQFENRLETSSCSKTCLTNNELLEYGKGKTLYGYHITNLKIYDKPKELSEFMVYTKKGKSEVCQDCKHEDLGET